MNPDVPEIEDGWEFTDPASWRRYILVPNFSAYLPETMFDWEFLRWYGRFKTEKW